MKISDLELFLLIVQEGSLNKAAEKCFMTEATLSQQLKKIEAEAGCQLFYRQKGKRLAFSIVDRRPVRIYLRKGHPMEHIAYRKEGIPYPLISPKVLESESFLLPGKGMPKQHALAIRIFQKYHIEPNIRETFQAMSYGAIMAERKRDRDIQHIIRCFREYFHFPPPCHC